MTDIKAEGASTDTPDGNRPAVDVLALTDQRSWDEAKALHRGLAGIVEGLDRPASEGPSMGHLVSLAKCTVADLAVDAGVDAKALQRHLDGVGPLSQIAFHLVFAKLTGAQATTA